ncbi:hypothetical protein TNCV_935761 [Trichonephila clavipes]|nr:hypothetical protein TNCV_935761 [Trichonephila clavipes]
MATGSYLTPNYSRSQSEIQGDLHKFINKISRDTAFSRYSRFFDDELCTGIASTPKVVRELEGRLTILKTIELIYNTNHNKSQINPKLKEAPN